MIQERVVSTMALVLEQFTLKVKNEVPGVNFVYDEKLTYDSSITKYRSDNNITEPSISNALPLFSFKRSVLRHSDRGLGMRGPRLNVKSTGTGTSELYKVVHGEIDIEFIFYCKTAQDAELFEIEYASDLGIPFQKELLVDTRADLGTDLVYYAEYQPLADKLIESDSSYFKAITGLSKVRGFYPVFKTNSKHILEVQANIYDCTNGYIQSVNNRLGSITVS